MAMPRKILTLNAISAKGLSRLPEHYTVGGDIADPDGILVRSANMHEMDTPASVQAIARAGAGTNNIPVKKLSERGVPVFNAPGANANAVKELVIAGMLIAARNLVPAIRFVEGLTGTDEEQHKTTEAGKKQFAGSELSGRTLGVIGLGAILHRYQSTQVDVHTNGLECLLHNKTFEIRKQAFSLVPEYLKTKQDDEVENLMDYGIQLGRRLPLAEALVHYKIFWCGRIGLKNKSPR